MFAGLDVAASTLHAGAPPLASGGNEAHSQSRGALCGRGVFCLAWSSSARAVFAIPASSHSLQLAVDNPSASASSVRRRPPRLASPAPATRIRGASLVKLGAGSGSGTLQVILTYLSTCTVTVYDIDVYT